MPMPKLKIKIENLDLEVEAEVGQDLRSALLEGGIQLYDKKYEKKNCHGHGMCTKCKIQVVECDGASDQSRYEQARIGADHRLACQTRVYQDAVIRTLHKPEPARIP